MIHYLPAYVQYRRSFFRYRHVDSDSIKDSVEVASTFGGMSGDQQPRL